MPTLYVLNGWKIQMFAREREEAHIHVTKDGEHDYRFRLADFVQLRTDKHRAPPSLAREVRLWGERNRDALEGAQASLTAGRTPEKLDFVA